MKIVYIILILILLSPNLIKLNGIIIDNNTNKPLSGINIYEHNSKIGTITSNDGNFSLLLKSKNIKLQISDKKYHYYEKTIYLNKDTSIFIKLVPFNKIKN